MTRTARPGQQSGPAVPDCACFCRCRAFAFSASRRFSPGSPAPGFVSCLRLSSGSRRAEFIPAVRPSIAPVAQPTAAPAPEVRLPHPECCSGTRHTLAQPARTGKAFPKTTPCHPYARHFERSRPTLFLPASFLRSGRLAQREISLPRRSVLSSHVAVKRHLPHCHPDRRAAFFAARSGGIVATLIQFLNRWNSRRSLIDRWFGHSLVICQHLRGAKALVLNEQTELLREMRRVPDLHLGPLPFPQ